MIDLSIVVPAFNEERRLPPTLTQLAAFLAARPGTCEVIVVDDGSTDGTVALCEGLARSWPALRVLVTPVNRGKGHAVRTGMLAARGAVRVMIDADGSTPAAELARLVDAIAGGAAVAIGSRYLDGRGGTDQPLWRRAWSRLAHLVVERTLLPGVVDAHCGYKAFTAAAAEDLFARARVDGWAFDIEILALARRRGHRLTEVPVTWHDDQASRVRPLADLGRVLREALAIRATLAATPPGPGGPTAPRTSPSPAPRPRRSAACTRDPGPPSSPRAPRSAARPGR